MARKEIRRFDSIERDEIGTPALLEIIRKESTDRFLGIKFGFFGIASTGKSSMINRLLDKKVAKVESGQTTSVIQAYPDIGYCLYEVPDSHDSSSPSLGCVLFWKGLTGPLILINATVQEMMTFFRSFDALELDYDIVVNKFDAVASEKREAFKQKIRSEVQQCQLKGVKNIWFVSAENPKMFPDWIAMVHYLTSKK